jgi:hypothetical protein
LHLHPKPLVIGEEHQELSRNPSNASLHICWVHSVVRLGWSSVGNIWLWYLWRTHQVCVQRPCRSPRDAVVQDMGVLSVVLVRLFLGYVHLLFLVPTLLINSASIF